MASGAPTGTPRRILSNTAPSLPAPTDNGEGAKEHGTPWWDRELAYCHTSGARGARNSNRADAAEIRELLGRLGLEPWDIARTGEGVAGELGMREWARDADSRERWISALAEHPVLIQRPIITAEDGTALVARSAEAVRDALGRGRATAV